MTHNVPFNKVADIIRVDIELEVPSGALAAGSTHNDARHGTDNLRPNNHVPGNQLLDTVHRRQYVQS